MKQSAAMIIREHGPFGNGVHGVTFDGRYVWIATNNGLEALDPDTGRPVRHIDVASQAGTAFDGQHLYQISGGRIRKIDPATGEVVATIASPDGEENSGLAWAEGSLWVGVYSGRAIRQVDPQTGEVLRTIESNRFVTGVTWVDGQLWHGTWEDDASELRRIDPESGEVLERVEMPAGMGVSGLESDGGGQFFCGGGNSGKLRVLRRPGVAVAAPDSEASAARA